MVPTHLDNATISLKRPLLYSCGLRGLLILSHCRFRISSET